MKELLTATFPKCCKCDQVIGINTGEEKVYVKNSNLNLTEEEISKNLVCSNCYLIVRGNRT